jgi:hypothetical protein
MTASHALRQGIGMLARNKRLCVVFYAVTTAAALLIAAPLMTIVLQSLGDSAWAQQMAANVDIAWFSEVVVANGGMPWIQAAMVALGVGAVSALVYLFLLGGAIHVLSNGKSFSAGCGRNFWRLVRLTVVSLLFYGGVFFVYQNLGRMNKLWSEGSVATPLVYWGWFRAAVFLVGCGFVNLVFDYARVRMVADDQRSAVRSAIAAFRFVLRHLRSTAGLYIAVCAIAALVMGAFLAFSHTAQTSVTMALLWLLVGQMMVFAKIWSRLLFCSTACALYGELKPTEVEPVVVPPADMEPQQAEPLIELTLAPELELNAFQFITAWNQTPDCRAAAEARLPGRIFDPARLTANTAVLTRIAAGIEPAVLPALLTKALDRPVQLVEEGGLVVKPLPILSDPEPPSNLELPSDAASPSDPPPTP